MSLYQRIYQTTATELVSLGRENADLEIVGGMMKGNSVSKRKSRKVRMKNC